jgi:5-methyltetrahydrofolate--homocysteine methyltransferase
VPAGSTTVEVRQVFAFHRAKGFRLIQIQRSAQQMVITAGDLKQAGITVPMLVGGAALSDKFTRNRIAPSYEQVVIYCKDAMTGLSMMNRLIDPAERAKLESERRSDLPVATSPAVEEFPETTQRSSRVRILPPLPAPYPDRKVRDVPQLRELWEYINPQMLYVRHLGFKTNFEKALAARDPKALELHNLVEDVKAEAAKFMKVKAVWQFFEAEAEGNSIRIYDAARPAVAPYPDVGRAERPRPAEPLHMFHFHRQRKPDGLCLADYVMPPQDSGLKTPDSRPNRDSIAIFVVGAGTGIRQRSEEYKAKGEYLKSHALQALAIETAEGCAEWLHRRIREDWGFPDPADMTMIDRFTTKYQGRRYSFGYPACPALEDQAGIWKLLKPEEIGVSLTEGFMMDPEASVSALVFHHPDCTYFGVGDVAE